MRAGYWSERSLRSYGCSYFSSDFFGDAVISVVERFQESAKQEEAAFHKLLSRRTHISGAAKREQPKHLSRAWLFMLPHLNNGDTGSALNRSLQSVKWVWGPLLLLLWKLRWRILTPVGSGQWGPPEVVNTSFYGVLLPSVSSGDRSANPATVCASGRSGLRRAHISRSTRKRCGLGMPAPSEEDFQSGQFRCFLSVRCFRTLFWLHN